ncbi:MAG TPA: hypothetical protein VMT86_20530 [Bryobacteraceae bacterium]|nr:hypothetical protein [Bryobacteraceae bacterium]
MNTARVLYHLSRADFLERVRRYSFLLTLAFAVALGYGAFTGVITLQLDQYRGVYNSAWVGSMMTLVSTAFITLAGFYMIKNSVQRDQQTRVGLVLATTPMTRTVYTTGKALSNFAVLAAMVAVLGAAAVVLQLARAERGIEWGKLLAPFLWVALPAMAMTAAVAVLFETLPVLRGGVGNVVYFFAWGTYLGVSGMTGANDYMGFGLFMRDMTGSLKRLDASYNGSFALQAGPTAHATKTFLWSGVAWTLPVILTRLEWIAIAIGIALFAAVFFHRFDPARERWRRKRTVPEAGENSAGLASGPAPAAVQLTPLDRTAQSGAFGQVVAGELRLMLKGYRWWWCTVAAALFTASLLVSDLQARHVLAGFAWLWPLLIWSQMGAREARYSTGPLLFACPHSLDRQLPAVWCAGVIVAVLTGGGFGLRLLISGDWPGFAAWLAGAMFIPSFALAAGVWSGSSKLFEAVYTMWWYTGPMNHTRGLDFISSAPVFYLVAALALMMAAYFGRRRQLGYA